MSDIGLVERTVLCSIPDVESLSEIRDRGVSEDSFLEFPDVFRFITKYPRKYENRTPTIDILLQEFPEFSSAEKKGSGELDWYLDELLKNELSRKIKLVLEQGIDLLVNQDKPQKSLDYIVSELTNIRPEGRLSRSLTDKDALKRLDKLIEKMELLKAGRSIGIPTGIEFLDENSISFLPGEVVGIMSNSKRGKSWIALYLACYAYFRGYRVLYFTPELTIDQTEDRWDTIMAKLCGYEFSNMGLTFGKDIDVNNYREFLEQISHRSDWQTIKGDVSKKPITMDVIEDLTIKHRPDVVVIDGIYLIQQKGKGKKDNWERVADISNELKALASSRDIVAIASNQLKQSAATKSEQTIEDSGYAYAFTQMTDKCIIISDPAVPNNKIKTLRYTGTRVGIDVPPRDVIWDVDKGIIGRLI